MSDRNDWDPTDELPNGDDPTGEEFDAPTISCQRCDRTWDLSTEFEELGVGNHAVEQFALDHERHTGHFPDDVSTWRATCRNCTEVVERLARDAATRWAETHVRHTRHAVELSHAGSDETTLFGDDE
ncbi:hypothetical protein [Halorussus sp. MSC15.2]|uniref:hypothetical protein n=1 Tax=Halorussus sp. MSC15.2 TaxID=2283638 RepID=UPI002815F3E7|nr:hypothetical protein [Halorussus sp. MSC15.2]